MCLSVSQGFGVAGILRWHPKPRLLGLPVEDIIAVQRLSVLWAVHALWPLYLGSIDYRKVFKTLPPYKDPLVFGARLFQTYRRGVGALE